MHHFTGPQGDPARSGSAADRPPQERWPGDLPELQAELAKSGETQPVAAASLGAESLDSGRPSPPPDREVPQVYEMTMPRHRDPQEQGPAAARHIQRVHQEHQQQDSGQHHHPAMPAPAGQEVSEFSRPHFPVLNSVARLRVDLSPTNGLESVAVGGSEPKASEPAAIPEKLPRALWLGAVVLSMIAVRYFVPWLAEEIQFAITRGRERAEYELAGTMLASSPLAEVSTAGQRVTKRIGPSVVHINVATVAATSERESPPVFFGRTPPDAAGQGSGVIVDEEGYIVTNYHVVRGASEIDVGLSDGRRVGAQLVGYDEPSDIAVLKVEAPHLTAAKWGDSEKLDVGSLVWAAGSPFGLQRTVTFGILSAKHRGGVAGTPYQDFLQTDAAVNPGNSGGPLVDEQGNVVGINTAIVGEAYQGVSFAVPSHVARDVYERLRHEGRVARGWLGVQMDDVSETLADQIGLDKPFGALVIHVVEMDGNSPALRAGVEPGDVILSWNGEEVTSPSTLSRLVARTQIGTSANLSLRRGREQVELTITVGERPPLE